MSKILKNHQEVVQHVSEHPPLPVIDWKAVHAERPTWVTIDDPSKIPSADIAIVTWTSDEWSAFDHVFLHNGSERSRYDRDFRKNWYPYPSTDPDNPILYFQLVDVKKTEHESVRVLLIKSQVHLAHAPWITGLQNMVDTVLSESGVKTIISTGTAGAAQDTQSLGDVVLTNAAKIQLYDGDSSYEKEKKEQNYDTCDYNLQTFTSSQSFADTTLLKDVKAQLMQPLANIWTDSVIGSLLDKLNNGLPAGSHQYTKADLVNDALEPTKLETNQVQVMNGTPLLTTDYYYTTDTDHSLTQYSFLEMDDAVIGHQAQQAGVDYGFIRNVSDPVVVAHDAEGQPVPASVQGNWSGMVYSYCGFYTSFNSALTCWAVIPDLV